MADREQLIHQQARCFYGVHQAQHLSADNDKLIDRCAQRLMDVFGLSLDEAKRHAREVFNTPASLIG